jgi:hypothetical protein
LGRIFAFSIQTATDHTIGGHSIGIRTLIAWRILADDIAALAYTKEALIFYGTFVVIIASLVVVVGIFASTLGAITIAFKASVRRLIAYDADTRIADTAVALQIATVGTFYVLVGIQAFALRTLTLIKVRSEIVGIGTDCLGWLFTWFGTTLADAV